MEKKKFHSSLKDLHSKIKESEHETDYDADPLLEDINYILNNPEKASFRHHVLLMRKLNEAASKFEVSHPHITSLINTTINTLNNIGI